MSIQFNCRWLPSRWLLALVLLAGSSSLLAQESLTLREALSRSLEQSPALAEFPYRERAAEARSLQAGLNPNPELSLEVENLAGSGRFEGADAAEVTLALSQVIELGGKRRQRQEVAALAGNRVRNTYEQARVEVLTDTAGRFLQVVQAEHQLALARTAESLADKAEHSARRRVEAGHSSGADLNRARVARVRATLEVSAAERTLTVQRRHLAASWGSTGADFGALEADLFALPEIPDYPTLAARLESSPIMDELLTRERLREAQWQLARTQGRQDLRIGAGIKRFEDTGDHAFTLSASIPLGVRNQNQGEARARHAEYEQMASERRALQVELDNELYRAHQQLTQSRVEALALREQALPEAEEALERIQEGYASGRYSYLELTDSQRERLALERDAINAAVGFFDALLTLERLTGEPLTESSARASNSARPARAPSAQNTESQNIEQRNTP